MVACTTTTTTAMSNQSACFCFGLMLGVACLLMIVGSLIVSLGCNPDVPYSCSQYEFYDKAIVREKSIVANNNFYNEGVVNVFIINYIYNETCFVIEDTHQHYSVGDIVSVWLQIHTNMCYSGEALFNNWRIGTILLSTFGALCLLTAICCCLWFPFRNRIRPDE